jgi:hypothetical protein
LLSVEGEEQRAIGHLESAVKIDPNHVRATEVLAEIEAEREDPRKS